MNRTKVFVSYSHADRQWLDRLRIHLAVLERRGFVELWSDSEIKVGSEWEKEIERGLTEARVAVLMISPSFLASRYVWSKEMPLIKKHEEAGMLVLPLVVRPCAWRVEGGLASLLARPQDGRALSTGTDSQIDLDLAAFTYELAGIVEVARNDQAITQSEKAEVLPAARVSDQIGNPLSSPEPQRAADGAPEDLIVATAEVSASPTQVTAT